MTLYHELLLKRRVFICNVRALNMHKIKRSKDALFNMFGLLQGDGPSS